MVGDGSQLRTREVAQELNLSESTVINYTKQGLLLAGRTVGSHRRYTAESVTELKKILDMPAGPERDAAMADLRRQNLALEAERKRAGEGASD